MGVFWMLVFGIGLTVIAIIHLLTIRVEEQQVVHAEGHKTKIDIKGTIRVIKGSRASSVSYSSTHSTTFSAAYLCR